MNPWTNKRKRGFTLSEILMVVVIVGVLIGLALPRFGGTVERVRASEGVHILTALLGAQKAFEFENGSYSGNINNLDISIPTPDNFAAPTVANNANAVASIVRTGGYTLSIDEDGNIACAAGGSITCAQAGY